MDSEDKGLSQEAASIAKSVAVPLYQDAVSPAAKQVGQSLETIAKAINMALAPVGVLVWGYERIAQFLESRLAEKLKDVPPERIMTPNPHVVGPTLEGMRYTGEDPELRELFANLLATSLDSETAHNAHPAFVEIIKQLTSDEAKVLSHFQTSKDGAAIIDIITPEEGGPPGSFDWRYRNLSLLGIRSNCNFPELTPSYIDNICRLGLAHIPHGTTLTDKAPYMELEKHPSVVSKLEECSKLVSGKPEIERKLLAKTALGRQFDMACVSFMGSQPEEPE